jgi:hypothetical protein
MHFLRRIKAAQENGEALSAHNQAAELSRKNQSVLFPMRLPTLDSHTFYFSKNKM